MLPLLFAVAVCLPAAAQTAAPEGFQRLQSDDFVLLYESPLPPAGILPELEGLRAKLLTDLVLFAPWAREAPIEVRVYKDAASYRRGTGAPAWSAGSAEPRRRLIQIFEGTPRRILAHELAHVFFDDFFLSTSTPSAGAPLWLTEGVATRMEWDYGLGDGAPRPAAAGNVSLAQLLNLDYRSGEPGPRAVAGWYAQAYRATRLLMTRFGALDFFNFCGQLRDGASVDAALSAAYGGAMPDTAALERRLAEEGK